MKTTILLSVLLTAATTYGQAGACDLTFDPGTGANSPVNAIVLQSDGKILIGGSFTTYNTVPRNGIARLNSDGSLDLGFDPGAGVQLGFERGVWSIAIQPDGKILIGGNFNAYNGTPRKQIARLNTDGSLDLTFNPGSGTNAPYYGIEAIAVQPDGKILIGGDFDEYNGTVRNGIARLKNNGSLDFSFDNGSGLDNGPKSIALQPDGKIIAGGRFDWYNHTIRHSIVRINSDGSLDTTFDPGTSTGTGTVNDIALQSDGKILIGGYFSEYNGTPRLNIARIQVDGQLDPTFDSGTDMTDPLATGVSALVVQTDGKILVGGNFTHLQGFWRKNIVRLNADGDVDPGFNPGSGIASTPYLGDALDGAVKGIALQADGNILVAGQFNLYHGVTRDNIARILAEQHLTLELTTDAFGSETTWELTRANGEPVATGGPYGDGAPTTVVEHIYAAPACYVFRLHDAGGNGIAGGGYVLKDWNGDRILDANGAFGALSTTGAKFCLPLGPLELAGADCDDTGHSASDAVHCTNYPDAIGYQFWTFDPHGSYGQRMNSTGPQLGPNRLAQLPVDLELNIRVRAILPGNTYTAFGPACTFMIDGPGMAPQELRNLVQDHTGTFLAWPNPVQEDGLLQVTLTGLDPAIGEVQVVVHDATRRVAYSTVLPAAGGLVDSPLDLGSMAQGVYLLQVSAGEAMYSTRVMVGR